MGDFTKAVIEQMEECDCTFFWNIENGQLVCEESGNYCFESNVLVLEGDDIAESIRFGGRQMISTEFQESDIPDEIWDKMKMSDVLEQGEKPYGEKHAEALRESLIEFLEEKVTFGWRLYRDPLNGFANQFESVIITPGKMSDVDFEVDDALKAQTPDEWAEDFLYNGDAVTQAYNSFSLVE